jgi:Uma2 family endonuclease
MRAVMVNVPDSLLAERRRTGADLFDEMWEGVLHMVPAPSAAHQRLNAELMMVLGPLAKAQGLVPLVEANVYHADDDYRVPDQLYARTEQLSDRGAEPAAVLVVEILSPGDETYDKLDWYAAGGVDEVLVVDPDSRRAEVFARRGSRMVLVESTPGRLESLGVELETVEGPKLRLAWDGGAAEV